MAVMVELGVWRVDPLFVYLVASATLRQLLTWAWRGHRPAAAEKVGTVSRITLYPVKSTAGIDLTEVTCTYSGAAVQHTQDRY